MLFMQAIIISAVLVAVRAQDIGMVSENPPTFNMETDSTETSDFPTPTPSLTSSLNASETPFFQPPPVLITPDETATATLDIITATSTPTTVGNTDVEAEEDEQDAEEIDNDQEEEEEEEEDSEETDDELSTVTFVLGNSTDNITIANVDKIGRDYNAGQKVQINNIVLLLSLGAVITMLV